MTVLLVWLRRALLSFLVVAAVVVTAALIYIRTGSFARLLTRYVNGLLTGRFQGEIAVRQIDTSISGALTIDDLSIRYQSATIVHIPRAQLKYSLIPLLWHEVSIEISAANPVIRLERDREGQWNLMRALAPGPSVSQNSGSTAFTLHVDKLGIRDGNVDLAPQASAGAHYRLGRVGLAASLNVLTTGLEARVTSLRTHVAVSGMPEADVNASLRYQGGNSGAQLTINTLHVESGASAITIAGAIHDLRTLDSDASVSIDRLGAADLSRFWPADPLREDVTGTIRANGVPGSMRASATLAVGDARLKANLAGDFSRESPTYSIHGSLKGIDLSTLVLPRKMTGSFDVSIDARGQGFDPQKLAAGAIIDAHNLLVDSARLGDIHLTGSAQHGDLGFSGRLANGPGVLTLEGTGRIGGSRPYQVALEAKHFDLARVLRSAPLSDLNSKVQVQGNGTELRTMNAVVHIQTARSMIANLPFESAVRARLQDQEVNLAQATILSQGTTVSVAGRTRIAPDATTQLSYRVCANSLAPWIKLAGASGDGRATLDGSAAGTLLGRHGMSLRTTGKLAFQSAHLLELSVGSGDAEFSLENLGGSGRNGWPSGTIGARLNEIQASGLQGSKLRTATAQVSIVGGRSPRIETAFEAQDHKDNANALQATIVVEPDRVTGTLNQATLTLPDGTWHLTQPSQFLKDQHHIAIQGFALANGVSRLTMAASIAFAGAQNVVLHAAAIDLAILRPLMPQDQKIAGDFSADLTVNGTSSAPSIDAKLAAQALAVNSHRVGDLRASVAYRPSSAALSMVLQQDLNHRLDLVGEFPITLRWTDGLVTTIGTEEHLRVHSAGIRLAPFADVAPRTLKNLDGILQTDLTLLGSPFHPAINGTAEISGRGEIVPLGLAVSDFHVRLTASPSSVTIAELSAKAGSGSLTGGGSVALHNDYSPGAINVDLLLNRWPAIATRQYNSIINGAIRASGTPSAPHIQGHIDVIESTIRPDLAFLNPSSAPPPDSTIVIVQHRDELASESDSLKPRHAAAGWTGQSGDQIFKALAIDLNVNVHRNNWIRHENAQIELGGEVTVKKSPGGPISLKGEIDTLRGWMEFMGKRFDLKSGQIRFTGGSEINPALYIDGQYLVSEYVIDVIVGGTASKPEVKLQSQPRLAQGDILSLILFGTTSSQLSKRQQSTLQQRAQSIAIGVAGQTVAQSLGLASLGVSVSGQSVGLGHYLSPNTYVSVSPNFGASTNSAPSQVASIQYFLQRWLSITTATMSDGSRQIFLNVNKRY